MVDFHSVVNGIIKRPLSIYHLTMKFPTVEGTGEVRGNQYDSRDCYNKSLKIAKKDGNLSRVELKKATA